MNEEEKRKYKAFQYWIQTNTEKGATTIPDNLCLFVVNLIEKLQKENEKLKELDLSNSKMIANMSERHLHDREKIRNSIPVQEVKDKIEELKEQYNVRELDFIKTTQDIRKIIIQSLEELIEGKN